MTNLHPQHHTGGGGDSARVCGGGGAGFFIYITNSVDYKAYEPSRHKVYPFCGMVWNRKMPICI